MDNIGLLLVSTLTMSAPLIAAALGGLFSERSGVVNIGIEGMMTFGAFLGAVSITFMEQTLQVMGPLALVVGVLMGIVGGMIFAWLHAFLSIRYKFDQIISGTAINMVTLALALYISNIIYGSTETPSKLSMGITIGDSNLYLIVVIIMLLVIVSWFVINKTKWGMRVVAVGENPQAADAMGINVNKIRYQAVLLSGALSGIAGICIVLTTTSRFAYYVVAGKGFIALAVMLFGRRKSFGILAAGLLFGFTSSLGTQITVLAPNVNIDPVYFDILPYVITIIALFLFSKNSFDPEALGTAYDKEVR